MSGASQGRGRGRGKPPKVPTVSTRVQGEHSPLPSSKCAEDSLPSTHHQPGSAGTQPLSGAMCGPPLAPSSGQELPAPRQQQAPSLTAGSNGGQGGFKKGLKAKWMQDTEQDRTRKEKDEQEEAKRRELSRKQLEETAARQLLEQQQAVSAAAAALAEKQRLQRAEEAAAAEAARAQEELIAKAAAQAKLDLQTQQEAEVKQQQEVELRNQQRLDADLQRHQQQQEAELKQQQEAEIRLQQELEVEERRVQEAKLKVERQQLEEQQQARKLKEDQDRKTREDAAKRVASIKALALLSSSNRSRSGIDDFEDSMFTALPSSRAPAVPSRVPETPIRSAAPSPSATAALNHQSSSSVHDGSKISPRPHHSSPAAPLVQDPSLGSSTVPPPPSHPQLDRSSSYPRTGSSHTPLPVTNKASLTSNQVATPVVSSKNNNNKQPSVPAHIPADQSKQTAVHSSIRSSSGPLPTAPTLHRSLSSLAATPSPSVALPHSSNAPVPSEPFELLASDLSPSAFISNHPVIPRTSLQRPSQQQLPTHGASCSLAADASKHPDVKQFRLDRNTSSSAPEPNSKKSKREEQQVGLPRTSSKAKLAEQPELEEWEQGEPLQCTKTKRPRLTASSSANDISDTHLFSTSEASLAGGTAPAHAASHPVQKPTASPGAKIEASSEAVAAAAVHVLHRTCSDISARSGISVPADTKIATDMDVDHPPNVPAAISKVFGNGTVGKSTMSSENVKHSKSGAAANGSGSKAIKPELAAVGQKLKGRPADRTPRPSTDSSMSPSPGTTPPPDFCVSGLKLEATAAHFLRDGNGPRGPGNGLLLAKQNSISSLEHDFDAGMAVDTPHESSDEEKPAQQQRPGKSKKPSSSNGPAAICFSPASSKNQTGPTALSAQPEQRKKTLHDSTPSQASPTKVSGAGVRAGKAAAAALEPLHKRAGLDLPTHIADTPSQKPQQRKPKSQGQNVSNGICVIQKPSPPRQPSVLQGNPATDVQGPPGGKNDLSPKKALKPKHTATGRSQHQDHRDDMDVDEIEGGLGFQDAKLAAAAAARHANFSESSEQEELDSSESEGAGSHGQEGVVRSNITLGIPDHASARVCPSHSMGYADAGAAGGSAPDDCMAGASWAGSHPHMPQHHTPGDGQGGGGGAYDNSRRSSGGCAATTTGLRGGGGRLSDGNQRVMPVASTTSSHPRPESVPLQPRVVDVLVDGVDTFDEGTLVAATQHRTVDLSRIRSFTDLWVVLEAVLGEALPPQMDANLVFLDNDGDWMLVTNDDSWPSFVNTARKVMVTSKC